MRLPVFEDDRARLRLTPRHYAYLRISEGCNQGCTFCTIPSIRGKMRSKPLERIVAEAKELIADGAFELNLIGQDTTSYGDDIVIGMGEKTTFKVKSEKLKSERAGMPGMLRAVAGVYDEIGVKDGWVRLMYAYPSNFSDEMIDAMAELAGVGGGKRVLPYIVHSLQCCRLRVDDLISHCVRPERLQEMYEGLLHRKEEYLGVVLDWR